MVRPCRDSATRPGIGALAAFSLALCAPGPVLAAADAPGAWAVLTVSDAFQTDDGPSQWRYWIDAQSRFFDLGTGFKQYLVRPAIGYKPGDNLSIWAGYARFRTRSASGGEVNENRYWQQLSGTAGQWRGGTITVRARLLQRFIDVSDDMALVLRTLVRYDRPIGDSNHSLILSIEPFLDFRNTDWNGNSGLTQNRAFVGIGWRALDKLTIETGYMNQYFWADTAQNVSNHLLFVNFRTRF
jgi:hypothetical protein